MWMDPFCLHPEKKYRKARPFPGVRPKSGFPRFGRQVLCCNMGPGHYPMMRAGNKTWRRLNQWMPWAFSNYSTWRILKSYRERELIEGIRSNLIQVLSQARIPAYCSTDPWNSLDTSSDTGRCISHLENKALFVPWLPWLHVEAVACHGRPPGQSALAQYLDGCATHFPEHREVWLGGALESETNSTGDLWSLPIFGRFGLRASYVMFYASLHVDGGK